MYRRIVANKIRATGRENNAGHYPALIDSWADSFQYRFHGSHALGGTRTSKKTMILWWERVNRLLPGAHFDVQDILVSGYPWRTRVAVLARVSGDLPGGERYQNTVFQFFTLVWGKVTSIETCEDVQILERALSIVADNGQEEALAEPLED